MFIIPGPSRAWQRNMLMLFWVPGFP
jgi:hypothetical protein